MFANGSGEVDVAQLILVDTDILIDVGRKWTEAVGYLEHMEQQATVGVSVITQMELIVGCRNKKEFRILERFLRRFRIVTLNEAIAATGVTLLRQYRLSPWSADRRRLNGRHCIDHCQPTGDQEPTGLPIHRRARIAAVPAGYCLARAATGIYHDAMTRAAP